MNGLRSRTLEAVANAGRVVQVTVTTFDEDLDRIDEEAAAMFARLAVAGINRERRIEACPGHEWEFTFEAKYLDGAEDALCRCGARRSEVEP